MMGWMNWKLQCDCITIRGRNFFLLHIIQKGSGPLSLRSSGYWKLFAQVVAWKDTLHMPVCLLGAMPNCAQGQLHYSNMEVVYFSQYCKWLQVE